MSITEMHPTQHETTNIKWKLDLQLTIGEALPSKATPRHVCWNTFWGAFYFIFDSIRAFLKYSKPTLTDYSIYILK